MFGIFLALNVSRLFLALVAAFSFFRAPIFKSQNQLA
jgi:hypothetical protein